MGIQYLEYNGITVFHIHKEDDPNERMMTYWFTTSDDGYEYPNEHLCFDVRDLTTWKGEGNQLNIPLHGLFLSGNEGDRIKYAMKKAIDQGLLPKKAE